MSQEPGAIPENLFRQNKRRKTQKRRDINAVDEDSLSSYTKTSRVRLNIPDTESDEEGSTLVKRPNNKKRGINFSANAGRPFAAADSEAALIPYGEEKTDDLAQVDRFVKPSTGVRVVEDKHLVAFVDSKLAELHGSSFLPQSRVEQPPGVTLGDSESELPLPDENDGPAVTEKHAEDTRGVLPKSLSYQSRSLKRRSRRQPPSKDEDAVARESMVDQILAESEVPMYDRRAPVAPVAVASAQDADEAAAEAFKAEFLANLEARTRRRPPAATTSAKGAQVLSKPKLGGSRSQREKMKALEEAKHAVGKK